jgi:glycosyltransferase involved in cell wall biosynthesis
MRYDIRLCCIPPKGMLGREIEKLGYTVDELGEDPSSLNPAIILKLIRYLRKQRPDILHTSLFNANFHGRIAGGVCGVPLMIAEEHGEYAQYNGIRFFPYRLADFFLSNFNDFILCCSERAKEDVIRRENLPRRKVISAENCLDVSMYKFRYTRQEIRERYGITDDETVFISVASLKPGKGHADIIDVFKNMKDMGHKVRCFFAGNGPLKDALEEENRKAGLSEEIIFLGNREDIADYLNASDVFILFSISEGLSIALMEAMFMGLASVATNVGSNQELIENNLNGLLIPAANKMALRDAMLFYLRNKNLVKEFGQKARSLVEKRYSQVTNYVNKYYGLWDKCPADKR